MYQHTLQTLFIATSLAALAGAPSALAQSTVAIDPDVAMQNASDNGSIRAVTLYPGRAAVTRAVQREFKQGLWALRISNLPVEVQAGSLQAKVNAAAGATLKSSPKLLAVEYSQTPRVAFSSSPEGIALAEKVQGLMQKVEFLKQDRALLAQHDKLIDQIGVRMTASATADGATQAVDLAAVAKQLEFVQTEKERILGVAREQNERNEMLARELQVANQQLESLGGADRTERSALVLMAIPESCTVDVELTYLVGNATWEPAYAVRAAGDRTGVTVEYDALVSQRTGEDWKDVKLSLSTAQPTRASSPPAVDPWYVDVVVPMPPVSAGAPASTAVYDAAPGSPMPMMAPMMAKSDSAVRKQLEEFSAAATVQETGTAVSFEIPRPVTIPTDASKKQRTRIGAFEPTAKFMYVAAPIVSESVFLRGDMTNSSAFQLLPGNAQVFMGGDFIGDTAMPSVAPKDEFKVFFGPDRALRATREVLSKNTGSSGLFGGSTVTTWNDRITLDNGSGREVNVELYDRRPISLNEKIDVKVSNVAPAMSTDKRYVDGRMTQGILRWDLTVPASARGPKATTVSWTVDISRANDVRTTPLPD
ncbi:MAG: hypothetical protein RL254_2125 [Planctomycetota bacterium]